MMEISTAEAARRLGITDASVRWRIRTGKLTGRRIGERVYVIEEDEVECAKQQPPKRGRPRKEKTDAGSSDVPGVPGATSSGNDQRPA